MTASRFLLTGGGGGIGLNVARMLALQGADVTIYDNLSAYPPAYWSLLGPLAGPTKFIYGDICDRERLQTAVNNCDRVVHLAALADVAACTKSPATEYDYNVAGFENVVQCCLTSNIDRLVFASSASVYGLGAASTSGSIFSESDPAQPISLYGNSKLWAERRGLMLAATHGLPFVALRLFSVYGAPQIPKAGSHSWCAAIFAMRLLRGQQIELYGDGKQIRDFIDVRDVARAFVMAVTGDQPAGTVVNVGSGTATDIATVAELVCECLGRSGDFIYRSRRADDPLGGRADTAKAQLCLGFMSQIEIKSGIETYCRWLEENFERLNPLLPP